MINQKRERRIIHSFSSEIKYTGTRGNLNSTAPEERYKVNKSRDGNREGNERWVEGREREVGVKKVEKRERVKGRGKGRRQRGRRDDGRSACHFGTLLFGPTAQGKRKMTVDLTMKMYNGLLLHFLTHPEHLFSLF